MDTFLNEKKLDRINWILDRLRRRKDNWDTDKDGLTRINKNTIWLAFGGKEHLSGLPPLCLKSFLRRRRFNISVLLRERSVVEK